MRRGGQGRREADAIDEAGEREAQPSNHLGARRHEAAARDEGLRQGADDEVDPGRIDAALFGKTAPGRAENPDRMRLVDEQPSAVPLLERDEALEVGEVAVHAVEAL